MHSDNYQKYIEAFRTSTSEYSFEEVRRLVLDEKRSRKFLPFWFYATASAPVLVALSILLFPGMFGLQRIVDRRPSSIVSPQSSLAASHESRIAYHESLILDDKRHTTKEEGRMTNEVTIEQKSITEKTEQKEISPSVKTVVPKTIEPLASPIHQVSESTDNSPDNNRFFAFISGGFPAYSSSLSYSGLLFASAGLRWQMTSASSLIFELRKNTFMQKYTANKLNFHDTTLIVGSQTYHNTIGVLSAFPVESVNNVFSLGAGYRLAFMENGLFIPFAEVILGASTQGGLTSEMAGVGYSLNSRFLLELALRSDQLYSRNSSPQGVFNINASISFGW